MQWRGTTKTGNPASKKRTWIWFNSSDEDLRSFLLVGIRKIIATLKNLTPKDCIEYTAENLKGGACKGWKISPDAAAAVYPPEVADKKILIGRNFFALSRDKKTFDGNFNDGDSQLLTLVHEVTHLKDVFHSTDDFYSTYLSIKNARDSKIRYNADSLAAYIVGITPRRVRVRR